MKLILKAMNGAEKEDIAEGGLEEGIEEDDMLEEGIIGEDIEDIDEEDGAEPDM